MSTLTARFWAKVDKNGPPHPTLGRCWIWTASRTHQGYGRFNIGGGKIDTAHRVAWHLTTGSAVPAGLTIDHRCRRTNCVNPGHMEVVTRAVNTARGNTATKTGVRTKTVCGHGHPLTPENSYLRRDGARVCLICRIGTNHRAHLKRGLNCRCQDRADALAESLGVAA